MNFFPTTLNTKQAAKLLQTKPELLQAFESAYQRIETPDNQNPFKRNAKDAAREHDGVLTETSETFADIVSRIITGLLADCRVWSYDGHTVTTTPALPGTDAYQDVTLDELKQIPLELRPQLTRTAIKKDIPDPSYRLVLFFYEKYLKAKTPARKQQLYGQFRNSLDTLDLDPVMYEMLGCNPIAMGYWLPRILPAIQTDTDLKIPKTKILKTPLPILQLTRLAYEELNRTTLDIVDEVIYKAFNLDENETYMIKTGTFSNKFDFRNVKVTSPKEVHELGEYLLFIQNYATMMCNILNKRPIYGVSTTNEWVVREFIEDEENNPCIYHGMPLHTEYRVFVDFNTREILGISPYWEPNTMKQRFEQSADSNEPDQIHDAVIYRMHEPTLMKRYEENKDFVLSQVQQLLDAQPELTGQWSIDIMQNGKTFWLIDMATADVSALNECVPKDKLKTTAVNWLPTLPDPSHH